MVITTPNIANIYSRFLLLFGRSLHNYRPLGILLCDDHITVVTKHQMINLLKTTLKLEMVAVYGFSYYEKKIGFEPKEVYARSGIRLRREREIMNHLMPLTFKEGIIYIAKNSSSHES